MDLKEIMHREYMPFAKSAIVERAISDIDGLKPSQRRVLYAMYKLNLMTSENRRKSAKIVGDTMGEYHPHGDQSIYETEVLMSSDCGAYNVPYVDSHGNFGKYYSSEMNAAAMRYTEAKLMPICKEMFDGINEGAVEMVDNYDGTTKEPLLLPVKFPSILVNTSNGVAVGVDSAIPTFALKNVCEATAGVIKGDITTFEELAKVLDCPEFSTGGYIHTDEKSMEHLCKYGTGSFKLSGEVQLYSDRIDITAVPFNTKAEKIVEQIVERMKSKELTEVSDVHDQIGKDGFKISVEIKRWANPRETLKKLCRYTYLRNNISYRTNYILNSNFKDEVSLLELLNDWIAFRSECIKKQYTFKYNKDVKSVHELETWKLIIRDIKKAADIITSNSDKDAAKKLEEYFGMDSEQSDYLLDVKTRNLTTNYAEKNIDKCNELSAKLDYTKLVTEDESERYKIMVSELERIAKEYGTEKKTQKPDIIIEDNTKEETKINGDVVQVIIDSDGYIKRLETIKDIAKYSENPREKEMYRFSVKNDSYIIIFLKDGSCRKVLVDSIDSSMRAWNTRITDITDIDSLKNVLFIDKADDYSGYFNIIYGNGRGRKVMYSAVSGNRKKYMNLYDEVADSNVLLTKENEFLLVTAKRKAAYCNLAYIGVISSRTAFKIASISEENDRLYCIQPVSKIPPAGILMMDRYKKGYVVSIKNDMIWSSEDEKKDPRKILGK